MNETLYHVFSTMTILAGVILTAAVLIGIVQLIRHWKSPEAQELDAPVRQYLLSEEDKASYAQQYE